jgi:hypothetical protein
MHPDSDLIRKLGGPAKVAELLGLGQWGVQRVHNWLSRGIPSKVKLERPDLFLPRAFATGGKRRAG